MSDHSSAVFNNSCLKVPRNPVSNHPVPVFEQKRLRQVETGTGNLTLDDDLRIKSPSEKETDVLKSFIEFFDSIPEYDDINHLSNKEFYRKLENLREKQRRFYDRLHMERKWTEDYKNCGLERKTTKPFCTTPTLNKNISKTSEEVESVDLPVKTPSRRSVRIEEKMSADVTPEPYLRPKSRFGDHSSIWNEFDIEDFKLDLEKETRSVPSSPVKNKPSVAWKDTITIPQPFQMTVRDEENKIVEEVLEKTQKPKEEKSELFKAHPVPIESQIPLFDKIMADQEIRSQIVRNKRKAELMSQMKPFSFTRRDEELQALTKRLSKSSPSVFLDDPPEKVKKFKAKPIPKNLFSNYIYRKMNEDEFYRSLQKKIRAEEMLKASSLPPSMAKREKTKPKYNVCPRSYRDFESDTEVEKKPNKSRKWEKELEDLTKEFMKSFPKYLKKSSRTTKNKKRSSSRNQSSTSRCSTTTTELSVDAEPINRSNLAALLRIQSARKRLEVEMMKRLEEAKLKEEARWREKLMRKRPVWEVLAYSHEEDLAMRLQMRREEERLRRERHRMYMEMMLGRVNQQPTLFERQSKYNHPKMGDDLLVRAYRDDEFLKDLIKANEKQYSIDDKEKKRNEEKEQCDSSSDSSHTKTTK